MAGLESHPLIEPLFCGLIIVFHIVREFWDNCGKSTPFIPAQTQLKSILSGKHAFLCWHKTCIQLWQPVMAMDVAAAKLRSQKGRTTQTKN